MGSVDKLKEQALAKKPVTVAELLESLKPQVSLAIPRHMNPDRIIRIALTAMRVNQELQACNPQSILASVMISSQLGLEIGVMGQAFLIPYKKVCTFVPGWMGILDLVNRAGKATAWTGAVYEGDEFEWALGDRPFIHHKPCGEQNSLTHTYAVARTKYSDFPILEVWTSDNIWKHRNQYNRVGDKHYSFKHPTQYARKIPLLQVLKYVPRSIELATAFSLDSQAELGHQKYEIKDVKSVIEGMVEPEEQNQLPPEREPGANDDIQGVPVEFNE